jgi:hypothetical protein
MKLTSTINQQHTQSLRKWLEVSKGSSKYGLIISCAKQGGLVRNNIFNWHYSWL